MNLKRTWLFSVTVFLYVVFFSTHAEACKYEKKFYVERYGAVGDGNTNDITAFQAITRDINANGGGTVVFPQGRVYSISIDNDVNGGHKTTPIDGAIAFHFEHCKKVIVDLNGSTIQLAPNHSSKYAIFLFFDCESFSLSNGYLIGDAIGHDYSPVIYNGKEEKTSHEWGYGVFVRGSKGKISRMGISRMTGDGIYFGSSRLKDTVYHARIEIEDCDISYCRRNGVSCDSSIGFYLTNSRIQHIGDWKKSSEMPVDMDGCLPKSGIDFEYEGKAGDVGEVKITRCDISDCTKFCIIASNTSKPETTSFEISDCTFAGSSVHTIFLSSRGKKDINDCRFNNTGAFFGDAKVFRCSFEMGPMIHYVSRTSFYNCSFVGTLEKIDSKHGCFIVGSNMDQALFKQCKFKNIKGYNDLTPASQGFSGYVYPVNMKFLSCEFDNCSFVVSQKNYDSRLFFDKCVLKNGCLIHNLGTSPITFVNTDLYDVNSYVTQDGAFSMNNCTIVQEDDSLDRPLLVFGKHIMNRCTIIDKVGMKSSFRMKYGVREYKIEAKDTDLRLQNDNVVTKGLTLTGGELSGVKADEFQGKQTKTVFK